MNWGKWIVASFIMFALFMAVLVNICVREDISLVSKDYYQEELVYQEQIQRMNNASLLARKPVVLVSGNELEVRFDQFSDIQQGELKLFRPSDIRFDKVFVLNASPESAQRFDVSTLPHGMYHARMQWSMNGKEYFVENTIQR